MVYNIIEVTLRRLDVHHTSRFVRRLYATHPNRDNLLGCSQMLRTFGVSSQGVYTQVESLESLPLPAILHLEEGFSLLASVDGNSAVLIGPKGKTKESYESVKQRWSGHALLLEADDAAGEPDFLQHRKQMRLSLFRELLLSVLLCGSLLLLLGGTIYAHDEISLKLIALLDLLGVFLSLALHYKEVGKRFPVADQLCSAATSHDSCSMVAKSDYGNVMGFAWADIGLAYFMAHLLTAMVCPGASPFLSAVSIAALPFCFWSVYCQRVVLRLWCPLCILIVCVLAFMGVVSFMGLELVSAVFAPSLFCQPALFGLTFAIVLYCASLHVANSRSERSEADLMRAFTAFRTQPQIVEALLSTASLVGGATDISSLKDGTEEAPDLELTVVLNPYCGACQRKMAALRHFVEANQDRTVVRYYLFPFSKGQEETVRCLIAACFARGSRQSVISVICGWYDAVNHDADAFLRHCRSLIAEHTVEVAHEFDLQQRWIANSGLRSTPALLVNGRKLPDDYALEDLTLVIGRLEQ